MIKPHLTRLFTLSAFALSLGVVASACAETTGQYIDDATITAKVKESILADSQLKVFQITVDTLHGTVTLGGSVDNKSQEDEAIKDAKLINGAAKVVDNLVIKTQ